MPLPGKREVITIRDAAIIFKNFTGEKKQYNAEGDRNFSVMLNEADALGLQDQGFNVKPIKQREDDDEQLYHLKVKINFANRPPRVWLVSNIDPETGIGRSRNMLGEGMVGILDQLESTRVDLTLTPYDWDVNGKSGRTLYLQSLFFTMYEDELEQEYANVQQIGTMGDSAAKAIESGAQQPYDFDGEVED